MAQPIFFALPSQNGAHSGEHIQHAAETHAEAIASALDVLQLLHDRGILELLRGMLGAGDRLVGTLTAAVDSPQAIRAIRNFILLTKFFGSIPPDILHSLVETVMEATEREETHRAPGLLNLLRRLGNEHSRHALSVTLDLLEAVGKGL